MGIDLIGYSTVCGTTGKKSYVKNSGMSVEDPEISGTQLLMKALSCARLRLAAILFENGGMDGNR
jgi:hypothetical protein